MEKISTNELGAELGVAGSQLRKICKKIGVNVIYANGQSNGVSFVSADDAALLRKRYSNSKFIVEKAPRVQGVYAVIVPSFTGASRLKIGWSDDIESRMATYRTIAPELKVLRVWQTGFKWAESMVLEIAKRNSTQVFHELFEGNEDAVMAAIDVAFEQFKSN